MKGVSLSISMAGDICTALRGNHRSPRWPLHSSAKGVSLVDGGGKGRRKGGRKLRDTLFRAMAT
jgi:hypothetical protein